MSTLAIIVRVNVVVTPIIKHNDVSFPGESNTTISHLSHRVASVANSDELASDCSEYLHVVIAASPDVFVYSACLCTSVFGCCHESVLTGCEALIRAVRFRSVGEKLMRVILWLKSELTVQDG